jgi:hypothetical protein
MKRILLSVLISFVLLIGYLVVSVVVVLGFSNDSNSLSSSAIAKVDVPLRLPKYLYYHFFPPSAEDFSTDPSRLDPKRAVVAVGFFVTNILLYSIPVYFLIGMIERKWKGRIDLTRKTEPPDPPIFPNS